MAGIALLAVSRNPLLLHCTQESFLRALMDSAQLGLDCSGGVRQLAHLVPFKNKKREVYEVKFIIGFQGCIELAARSGYLIDAKPVYSQDKFDVNYGTNPEIIHKPYFGGDNNAFIGAYAIARRDGVLQQMWHIPKKEIDVVKARSQAGQNGPWVTDYVPMALKTAIKRVSKYLPDAPELAEGIEKDYDMPTLIKGADVLPPIGDDDEGKSRTDALADTLAPDSGPSSGEEKEQKQRDDIMQMLNIMYNDSEIAVKAALREYTGFDGKEGRVEVDDVNRLKDKWLNTAYGKIKKDFQEYERGRGV